MSHPPEIRPFDRLHASQAEYEQFNQLANQIDSEARPDHPPTSLEETKVQLQNVPPIFHVQHWIAWTGDTAVGHGEITTVDMDTNQHLAQFNIGVSPTFRRRGLATSFLQRINDAAGAENRTLLVTDTTSTVPAGEAFMVAIGGDVGLANHWNKVQTAEVDRGLLRRWLERAPERAPEFELVEWVGRYPEDQIDAVVELLESMNLMPTDDLDIEDFHWTADQLRQMDDAMEARGQERWTLVARENATGRLAGYSELMFNPRKPSIANQGGTAVFKEYQNRGLGRWLKAAMLEKLLNEKAEVEVVETGNAQSNAPMLKINEELGFRPSMTQTYWQVDTGKVAQYLSNRPVAG